MRCTVSSHCVLSKVALKTSIGITQSSMFGEVLCCSEILDFIRTFQASFFRLEQQFRHRHFAVCAHTADGA